MGKLGFFFSFSKSIQLLVLCQCTKMLQSFNIWWLFLYVQNEQKNCIMLHIPNLIDSTIITGLDPAD